ncbi:cytochrome [Streptomyces bungoensis]|uniref:Cytochrome n=1 Tax=Streptomyces bungoensis TaxID=285568 RepID=A0A101SLK3_9ACTN|nr:cytochrome P450 [Streptomyces bungoensis]KUN76084.1 cytochrome [Streptomyces bungoensis]
MTAVPAPDGPDVSAPPEVGLDGGATLLAWLRRMRDEQPVWRDPAGRYHVFRHEDVQRITADPATFSSDTVSRLSNGERQPPGGTLLLLDPPRHGKLRRLVSKVFTARMIEELAPRITQVATELLDGLDGRDRFDLVEAFANPLPVIVISSMLGVPPADRPLFQVWADSLLTVDWETPQGAEVLGRTVQELDAYLRGHVAERRARAHDDLMSLLVRAEVDGERLNDDDVVSFAALLLLAGHVTTAVLLGNMLLTLDQEDGHRAELRSARAGIAPFTEEVLRLRPPFLKVERVPTVPVEIAGEKVPENTMVYLWLLSANRDERVFPEPDRFLPGRSNARQLAFGHGIHYCLGAPLARMEGQIALDLMLERYADIRVDHESPLSYFDNRVNVFGLRRLPLAVSRA